MADKVQSREKSDSQNIKCTPISKLQAQTSDKKNSEGQKSVTTMLSRI